MHNSFKENLKFLKKLVFKKNFSSSNKANGGVNSFKENFSKEKYKSL